jgi:hypothetical protein
MLAATDRPTMADAFPSPPAAPSPRLRLAGVVAADPPGSVLARVTMRAEGNETPSGLWSKPFDLVLDSGDRVRVEAAPDAQVAGPEGSARGPWSDVEQHPLAGPFRGQAPGPHIEVKLRGMAVSAGDRIEILAEVLERDTADGPMTHRESPPRRISAVRAHVIAAGPGARAAMAALCRDEIPALARAEAGGKRFPWKGALVTVFVLVGLGLVGKAMFTSPSILLDLIASFIVLGAWLHDLVAIETETPRFRAAATEKHDTDRGGSMLTSFLAVLGIVICLVLDIVHGLFDAGHNTYPVAPLLGAVALAVQAVSMWWTTRYPLKMARLLAAAPAGGAPPADGEWGVSAGKVEDPTPTTDTAEPAAMGVSSASETPRLLHEGTFFVKTAAGDVEIDPRGAVWASGVRKSRTVTQGEETKTVVEEIVPIGAAVVLAGRWKRREGACPLLEATGPESLVLFAVAEGLDPVKQLRGLRRSRWIGLCLDCAGAAALVAMAVFGR